MAIGYFVVGENVGLATYSLPRLIDILQKDQARDEDTHHRAGPNTTDSHVQVDGTLHNSTTTPVNYINYRRIDTLRR